MQWMDLPHESLRHHPSGSFCFNQQPNWKMRVYPNSIPCVDLYIVYKTTICNRYMIYVYTLASQTISVYRFTLIDCRAHSLRITEQEIALYDWCQHSDIIKCKPGCGCNLLDWKKFIRLRLLVPVSLPSRELTYPTLGSSENHWLKRAFYGNGILE